MEAAKIDRLVRPNASNTLKAAAIRATLEVAAVDSGTTWEHGVG